MIRRLTCLDMGLDIERRFFSSQPSCKYSHDWYLSQEQLVTLAKNAKKAPCNFYKNGERLGIRSRFCGWTKYDGLPLFFQV